MSPDCTTTHNSSVRRRRFHFATAAAVASISPLPRRLFCLAAAASVQSRPFLYRFHFDADIVAVILLPPLPPYLLSRHRRCYFLPAAAAKSSLRRRRHCCCRLFAAVADVATVSSSRHCRQVKLAPSTLLLPPI